MKNKLVTIMKFTDLFALRFVKEKLEFEGIDCFLTDEGFDSENQVLSEGWNLKVKSGDVEKAIKILLQVNKKYDLNKIQEDDTIKGLKKILVPLDLVHYSLNTCRFAFGIAEKMVAEIKFLYVIEDPTFSEPMQYRTSWEEHDKIEKDEAYSKAQSELQKFSEVLKNKIDKQQLNNVKFHFALHSGKPENTIAELGERYKPELILMEQKDSSKKEKEHLAKTTHYVIDHTKFPVLTIPEGSVFQNAAKIKIMHATDFHETDFNVLNKLLEIVESFDTKIYCFHFDVEHNQVTPDRVDRINQLLKKEYSNFDVQAETFENA